MKHMRELYKMFLEFPTPIYIITVCLFAYLYLTYISNFDVMFIRLFEADIIITENWIKILKHAIKSFYNWHCATPFYLTFTRILNFLLDLRPLRSILRNILRISSKWWTILKVTLLPFFFCTHLLMFFRTFLTSRKILL